ncbi:MAG: DUF1302 domain-containing protein [Candidatus Omnitrophica bacterium]|nr:DUF1302 domain-containing protein [Candidatus Omnitrophota bacterium]
MKFSFPTLLKFFPAIILATFTFSLLAVNAAAFQFQYKEISGFVDSTISSGTSIRLEERDPRFIGRANGGTAYSVNGDDGDRNFSKGTLISSTNKMTHDIGASYQNFSTFVRMSYFFDPVNRYKKELTPYQRDLSGRGFNLLDAYIEGKFKPIDKDLNIRVGKQVLNWGESTFIPGGLSVINAINIADLRRPGSEIREAFVPTPMISDSLQLTNKLSLSNFYLFKYDRSKSDVCGTFFSTSDSTCEGGNGYLTSGYGLYPEGTPSLIIARVPDKEPSNSGQYGAAVRYLSEELNNSEFGFYFINYHSRVGVGSAIASTPGKLPSFRVEYPENLQVLGFTASTDFAGLALQGEYTYRPDYPFQIETTEVFAAAQYFPSAQVSAATAPGDIIKGWHEMPVNQLQGTVTKAFGRENPFFADEWIISTEAAMIYISHFPEKNDLRFEAPGTDFPAYSGLSSPEIQRSGWADRFSWGYVIGSSWTYNQVLKNIDLIPRFAFSHNVNGTTPAPLSQFVKERLSFNLSLTALYSQAWSVDLSYTNYCGASIRNSFQDRDFASVTVKHWF